MVAGKARSAIAVIVAGDAVSDVAVIDTERSSCVEGESWAAGAHGRISSIGSSIDGAGASKGNIGEDEVSVARLASIVSVASHTTRNVAADTEIIDSVKSEHTITRGADSAVLIASRSGIAVAGTRRIAVSINACVSSDTSSTETAGVAAGTVTDGAKIAGVIDEGVKIVAVLALIGTHAELTVVDTAGHA